MVGPPRTATTWLHRVLEGHAGLPRYPNEMPFFSSDSYRRGLGWYEQYFSHCPAGRPIVDVAPDYFGSELARERVVRDLGGCRVICILRDPVERSYSYYKLMRRQAWTKLDFESALLRHGRLSGDNRYAHHVAQWWERLGEGNVLVCLYDELARDPQGYLDRICAFIGIPGFAVSDSPVASARVNAISRAPRSHKLAQNGRHVADWLRARRMYRTMRLLGACGLWRFCWDGGRKFAPLDPALETRLRERFAPEVEAVERLLGRDLASWKHRAAPRTQRACAHRHGLESPEWNRGAMGRR